MGIYVHYGCGLHAPEGWMNFDVSPTLRMQKIPIIGVLSPVKFPDGAKYGDIRKGLPLADGSVDAVYCSHVLEHLALDDFRLALRNTFRMLRSGGIFRLVLPDLRAIAKDYLSSSDPDAAKQFMQASVLGRPTRPKGVSGMLRAWIGNSEHLWMWDFESLSTELSAAGFGAIRRASIGDSGDAMFDKVEDPGRWGQNSLGMQCDRPGG